MYKETGGRLCFFFFLVFIVFESRLVKLITCMSIFLQSYIPLQKLFRSRVWIPCILLGILRINKGQHQNDSCRNLCSHRRSKSHWALPYTIRQLLFWQLFWQLFPYLMRFLDLLYGRRVDVNNPKYKPIHTNKSCRRCL